MGEALVALEGVGKRFGGVEALRDVSLTLDAAEVHCLAGENGSGKSTLIKIIAGVVSPDRGEIRIAGERVARLDPKGAIARGIQVIYQDFSLFPSLSVAENLALPTEVGRGARLLRRAQVRAIAEAALERIGVALPLDAEVGTLSTAERQLVAIARALISAPRLLIMDEPTTTLTGRGARAPPRTGARSRALISAPRLLLMDEPTTTLTGREIERLFAVVRELRAR